MIGPRLACSILTPNIAVHDVVPSDKIFNHEGVAVIHNVLSCQKTR